MVNVKACSYIIFGQNITMRRTEGKRQSGDGRTQICDKMCEADGCMEEGAYKAPKSIDDLRDYQWLCLEHVKEHNKKWNYFDGMERDEIEDFMHDAVTGHRPTWKREEVARMNAYQARLEEELDVFLNNASKRRSERAERSKKEPRNELRESLALLGLDQSASMADVQKSYRELVKKFHPDLHGGSKSFEDKFKQITEAYQYLKKNVEV